MARRHMQHARRRAIRFVRPLSEGSQVMRMKLADRLSLAAAAVAAIATIAASILDSDRTSSSWVALAAAAGGAMVAAALSLTTLRRKERLSSSNRVFIIHAHEDADKAKVVADWLRDEGFEPWLDTERILAGQQWKEGITKGLEESGAALLLVTSNLDTSKGSTSEELRRAMAELRSRDPHLSPVIPVLFQGADMPPTMRDFHAAPFRDEAGRANIRNGLRRVLTGT